MAPGIEVSTRLTEHIASEADLRPARLQAAAACSSSRGRAPLGSSSSQRHKLASILAGVPLRRLVEAFPNAVGIVRCHAEHGSSAHGGQGVSILDGGPDLPSDLARECSATMRAARPGRMAGRRDAVRCRHGAFGLRARPRLSLYRCAFSGRRVARARSRDGGAHGPRDGRGRRHQRGTIWIARPPTWRRCRRQQGRYDAPGPRRTGCGCRAQRARRANAACGTRSRRGTGEAGQRRSSSP